MRHETGIGTWGGLRRWAAAGALAVAIAVPAAEARGAAEPGGACARATAAHEAEAGIPRHLLAAISLAESGRWDAERRENVAWPWTVMAEGRGRFLPTKAAAIAEVRALQAQGVANIDVGCMQVNLRHHPDAFASLDEAFDPGANVAYAAGFLRRLFDDERSWHRAAGRYHSSTPALGRAYRIKVLTLWNARRREAAETRRAEVSAPPPIDGGRTTALNTRRHEAGAAIGRASPEAARRHRLDSWHNARLRRLVVEARDITRRVYETQRRLGLRGPEAERRFEDRRRRQLDAWRTARPRTAEGS